MMRGMAVETTVWSSAPSISTINRAATVTRRSWAVAAVVIADSTLRGNDDQAGRAPGAYLEAFQPAHEAAGAIGRKLGRRAAPPPQQSFPDKGKDQTQR
jgi:hypothetical protein